MICEDDVEVGFRLGMDRRWMVANPTGGRGDADGAGRGESENREKCGGEFVDTTRFLYAFCRLATVVSRCVGLLHQPPT